MMEANIKKGIILVLATAIISGVSIFVNSYGVKETDSSVYAFMKNFIVALLLLAFILGIGLKEEIKKLSRKQWAQLAIIGLIGGSVPFLLFFKGLQMTSGSTASFVHKTLFVYTSVLAFLFLREKMNKGMLIGAILLILGNYFLIKPDFEFTIGHVLVFFAAVMWAGENVYAKHVLKEQKGSIVAFGRMLFGSLFILLFLLATGKYKIIAGLKTENYLWIIVTSIFLLLYNLTYYNGLKRINVSVASAILTIGLPITILLTNMSKGVSPNIYTIIGILLIIGGITSILWLNSIIGATTKSSVKTNEGD